MGYAALRALQESAGHDLPPGAHTSESHLERGLVDAVVPRPQLRDSLALLLDLIINDYRLTSPREVREGRPSTPPAPPGSRSRSRATSCDPARATSSPT